MKKLIEHLYSCKEYRENRLSRNGYGQYQQGFTDGADYIINEIIKYHNKIISNRTIYRIFK